MKAGNRLFLSFTVYFSRSALFVCALPPGKRNAGGEVVRLEMRVRDISDILGGFYRNYRIEKLGFPRRRTLFLLGLSIELAMP